MRLLLYIFIFLFGHFSYAQNSLCFTENKGQWEEQIAFKAKIPAGNLYLEQNKLTYLFYNENDMARMDEIHHGAIKNPSKSDSIINLHAFHVEFLNSLPATILGTSKLPNYENYYLGNNPSKWASNVNKYNNVSYQNLYDGIELKFYTKNNTLKYDFIVNPNSDVSQINLKYSGTDNLIVKNGHLYIQTSVNTLIEHKPYAYIKENNKEVKCNFKLSGDTLSFNFPKGYDKSKTLIIDPALIFASYSGATVGNWGFTSTYDSIGHLYGGGVAFGVGYPTTIGAFQINFNGGVRDASISKFSEDGSLLLYSTYIGGNTTDSPHSLVVDNNNNLIVFGTTNSSNFPTDSNSFDNTINGSFDIFVVKLNESGSYIASTLIGGAMNDGLNQGNPLKYNYADDYRGEVIVDDANNIYVASTTLSDDFPTTTGVISPNFIMGDQNQNACLFKFSPNLNNLIWSTYFGGNMDDAAYSLQFDELGNILFTGGTKSWDLPTSNNAHKKILGGVMDGYVAKINQDATSLLACTYIGTDTLDQTFFVQLDTANNVYVIGQTTGEYPIFPAGVYNDSISGQFIHKLTPDLSSTVFSTTFGTGEGGIDISLSAFLVNECNYILISGWGGSVNALYSLASSSSTMNLPITDNAIQNTTDGSDYYLMMLGENADTLMYATFFGGSSSSEHVDGGTSRFDKRGIVYQAVCAGCFGNNDFPTTPGAWSNINGTSSPNVQSQCNLGVFKIDLTRLTANAEVYTTPYYCVGDTVYFQNLSNGGVTYYWDFGDGETSNQFEPSHVFDSAGTYHVMLVALDSISCILKDTDYVDVFISPLPVATINPINGICLGDSLLLDVSGGSIYSWSPNYHISDTSIYNPTVWPEVSTTYTVVVQDSCGSDTLNIIVEVYQPDIGIIPDTSICRGSSIQLEAWGGKYYDWSPDSTLNLNNVSNPIASPYYSTTYDVSITDINNCIWDTFLNLSVDTNYAQAIVSNDTTICNGDSVLLSVRGGESYVWTPSESLSSSVDSIIIAFPNETTTYNVVSSNSCNSASNSIKVHVLDFNPIVSKDTSVCVGEKVNLWASGGVSFWWVPSELLSSPSNSNQSPTILAPSNFMVEITDSMGCKKDLSVFVDTLPIPKIELPQFINSSWGSIVQIEANTNGSTFFWNPSDGLSCTDCLRPEVNSQETTTYYLMVTDSNGCVNTDSVTVYYDGVLYVPNAFTPNGDGVNDIFYAFGKDIVEFNMQIFDRWGELMFETEDLHKGWDGTYRGNLVKTETYVWKIKYEDTQGNPGDLIGTVTLIY